MKKILIIALLSFSLIRTSYADSDFFKVDIPNSQGGYTTLLIQKSGTGYSGPRGEYYANFPSVYQLQQAYGTNQRMVNEAIERQKDQASMGQAVLREKMLQDQMTASVQAHQLSMDQQQKQLAEQIAKNNREFEAKQKAEQERASQEAAQWAAQQKAEQINSQNQTKVNSTGGGGMGALFFPIVLLGILIFWGISKYNTLVQARESVRNALNQINVLLKRRHDLIPNLVDATKGYMGYEKDTLEKVTKARQTAVNAANVQDKAQAENILTSSLRGLFAVAENYPNLKADQSVLQLQSELSDTENKISEARQQYNNEVKVLNVFIQSFPDSIVAAVGHFEKAPFFQGEKPEEDAQVPQVNLK